jgi:hypothetical protein
MAACPECAERIPSTATRCPLCGADLKRRGGGRPRERRAKSSSSPGVIIAVILGVCFMGLLICVGVLTALLLPAVHQAREAARQAAQQAHSRNNLKQIGLAMHNYHDVFQTFPPGGIFDETGRGHHGWQTSLLPYMGQGPLYNEIDFHVPWDDPKNQWAFQVEIPPYLNPDEEQRHDGTGYALSHYAGNVHALSQNSRLPIREVTDGTSNTILAGEVGSDYRPWGHPSNWRDPAQGLNRGPGTFGNPSGQGCTVLMMDGSVRTLNNDIDPRVLQGLATPAGGEEIPWDF